MITLPIRTHVQTERMVNVNRLYCQGVSQNQIAKRLEIPLSTVQGDLHEARQLWLQSTQNERKVWIAQELNKLDVVEAAAWDQWAESCKPIRERRKAEESASASAPMGKTTKVTGQRGRIGDARLLAIILKCVEQRRAMLGLDAPPQSASDIDRELQEPTIIEVTTREAARLVMESTDGRLTVKVSDGPAVNPLAGVNVLPPQAVAPSAVESALTPPESP